MVLRTHLHAFGYNRDGVTLLELMIVLVILGFMLAIGGAGLTKAAADRGATTARDTYIWMARRARGAAVQRGQTMRLTLSASENSATLATGAGTVLDRVYFKTTDSKVTLSSGDSLVICYTPRGFARTEGCSSGLPATATFTRGPKTAVATAQLLGQVQAQ